MAKTFKDYLKKAPPSIHVSKTTGGVTLLTPGNTDHKYSDTPYSNNYTDGTGTRRSPYSYRSAAPVSPHYAIVDLWSWCRDQLPEGKCFIKINDWVLEVGPDGVTAEDGHFTKLS